MPYINFFWTLGDGPVVVEIPTSADGVGVFGTVLDAWQRPIDDVGAKGRDGGNGGRSNMKDVQKNDDGSVDIILAPRLRRARRATGCPLIPSVAFSSSGGSTVPSRPF